MSSNQRRINHHAFHETSNRHNRNQTDELNAIKKALFTDPAGTGNTAGENLSALNQNLITSLTKLDTIATNTANIHIDVESVNLNVDTLEALQTSTKNALFENTDGTGLTGGQNLSALNSNAITRNAKLDTIITNTAASATTGLATESTLSAAEAHLGNIETAVQLLDNIVSGSEAQVDIVSSALPSGAATESTLSAAEAHLGNIETAVQLLDNIVSGSEAQVDIVSSALPTGAATQATLADAETHLGNIDTGIDVIEACVGSNKVNVNISSGNITGFATESTLADAETHLGNIETSVQLIDDVVGTDGSTGPAKCISIGATESGGNIQELLCDGNGRLSIDVNSAPTTAVTNSALTSLASAINSNRVDVNIANGGFNGAVTNAGTFAVQVDGDALTSLQLIDDVVKAEDAAHSGGDKGIMGLSVRKDTATTLASHDADYCPLITDANGRLHVINVTAKSNGSETSYVSGQSISGSGTFEGSAIAIDPNVTAIYAEHNFSHTGIKFEILASIDGSNFFSTGVEFNAGGMTPATLTGLSTIKGVSGQSEGFTPHIKFKFSNSDSSAQNATLSFVLQSS